MVEFNIPPTDDEHWFAEHIYTSVRALDAHIKEITDGRMERDFSPSRLFSSQMLEHPQAQVFGCSPDFDAYRGGQPFEPVDPRLLREADGSAWRFAGGHVHVGYDGVIPYPLPPHVVAHFLDLFLGIRMATYEAQQGKRAELYGLPGRYRPTPYGIEYRSLSNLWVHSRDLSATVAATALNALRFLINCPVAQVSDLYGQIPWPSLRAALVAKDTAQLNNIRGFVTTTFPRHPIKEWF